MNKAIAVACVLALFVAAVSAAATIKVDQMTTCPTQSPGGGGGGGSEPTCGASVVTTKTLVPGQCYTGSKLTCRQSPASYKVEYVSDATCNGVQVWADACDGAQKVYDGSLVCGVCAGTSSDQKQAYELAGCTGNDVAFKMNCADDQCGTCLISATAPGASCGTTVVTPDSSKPTESLTVHLKSKGAPYDCQHIRFTEYTDSACATVKNVYDIPGGAGTCFEGFRLTSQGHTTVASPPTIAYSAASGVHVSVIAVAAAAVAALLL